MKLMAPQLTKVCLEHAIASLGKSLQPVSEVMATKLGFDMTSKTSRGQYDDRDYRDSERDEFQNFFF